MTPLSDEQREAIEWLCIYAEHALMGMRPAFSRPEFIRCVALARQAIDRPPLASGGYCFVGPVGAEIADTIRRVTDDST